jgi:hypothetical protein
VSAIKSSYLGGRCPAPCFEVFPLTSSKQSPLRLGPVISRYGSDWPYSSACQDALCPTHLSAPPLLILVEPPPPSIVVASSIQKPGCSCSSVCRDAPCPAPSPLPSMLSMHHLCLPILALIAQHFCQIIHARQCMGILLAQHPFDHRQYFSSHRLRLIILTLIYQHQPQVVHAHQCVAMLLVQHLLSHRQYSFMHLHCLDKLVLIAQHHGQIVQLVHHVHALIAPPLYQRICLKYSKCRSISH